MKCLYACNQPGPAIEAVPDVWLIFVTVTLAVLTLDLINLPVIKTERELRNEQLKRQPSTRPGWSFEENRARVLAHLANEAKEERERGIEVIAAEFNVDAALVIEHEQELVA